MSWLDELDALRREGFVVVFKLDGERSAEPYTVVVLGRALGHDAFHRDGASLEALAREAVSFVRGPGAPAGAADRAGPRTLLDELDALRREGFVVVFKLDGERSSEPYTVVVSGHDAFHRDGGSLEELAHDAVAFVRGRVLTLAQAREVALAHLLERQTDATGPLALLDDLTREDSFGWVFSWNTARFAQTRAARDGLPGNGPFVVERGSGKLHEVVGPLERFLHRLAPAAR